MVNAIRTRGRFALGEGEDFFGVWDRDRPEEPLHRFPATEAGFAEAQAAFKDLVRRDREVRDVWRRALRIALFVALGVWVVTRVLTALLLTQLSGGFSSETVERVLTGAPRGRRVGEWQGIASALRPARPHERGDGVSRVIRPRSWYAIRARGP